jgi:hypothetical protein
MEEMGIVRGEGGEGEEDKEREGRKKVRGERRKWNKRRLSKLKFQKNEKR